ncbi:hypothetical protein ERUR111494_00770 [Erysipelothrix urinaevulpis]|nr:hypothetical protein [Erysipelothrix urinaevulpis]
MSTIFFFLQLNTIQAKSVLTNDRSLFTYEINNLQFSHDKLNITGWGLLQNTAHFNGQSDHQYSLTLDSGDHQVKINLKKKRKNLNRLIHYRGYKRCLDHSSNRKSCNYDFTHVGFEGVIPLNSLKTNRHYKVFLTLSSKKMKTNYQTSIFYPNDRQVTKSVYDKTYTLKELSKTKTVIVVTHDTDNLERFDKVVQL